MKAAARLFSDFARVWTKRQRVFLCVSLLTMIAGACLNRFFGGGGVNLISVSAVVLLIISLVFWLILLVQAIGEVRRSRWKIRILDKPDMGDKNAGNNLRGNNK